jgi:4-hydroxybenzoate polyprenyltransferase
LASPLLQRFAGWLTPIRFWDWWEFKTPVFLGVAWATAALVGLPAERLPAAALQVVGALVPVATYVCVINELTDLDLDRRAGKHNTMEGRSRGFRLSWLVLCLLGGIGGLWLLRGSALAQQLYGANWLVFSLYSVPPIRLKTRGAWGVLADACGGQLLPSLWSAFAVAGLAGAMLPPLAIATLTLWAAMLGLRGILCHQLADLANDKRSGADTLATRLGEARVQGLVLHWLFPLELVGWLGVYAVVGSAPAVVIGVGVLIMEEVLARRNGRGGAPLVRSSKARLPVLFRYAFTGLPLSMAIALAPAAGWWVLLLLLLQFLVFPGSWGWRWQSVLNRG